MSLFIFNKQQCQWLKVTKYIYSSIVLIDIFVLYISIVEYCKARVYFYL